MNNISINFYPNQVYAIVGLDGAGRTTFFNSLSANLKIDFHSIEDELFKKLKAEASSKIFISI